MIADQLGHSRMSMTQDVYMGRRAVNSRVAEALDDLDLLGGVDGADGGKPWHVSPHVSRVLG